LKAVIESVMTGKPLDPEMRERIREKARKIWERIFQEHGYVDSAVPAIRELRDNPRSWLIDCN